MGCGISVDKKAAKKKKNDRLSSQLKYTCFIFGMPDRDENQTQELLSKTFMTTAFSQMSYSFVAQGTSRFDRKNWASVYTEDIKVLISFFFVDLSTPGSTLLSIQVLNWFLSQIPDKEKPVVIAKLKSQKEQPNLQTLQEKLTDGLEILVLNSGNQQEMQKIVQRVQQAIQKLQEANQQ